MAEYIEREVVREAFREEFDNDYADDITDRLPAADVAPVRHGRWIGNPLSDTFVCCSICGYTTMRPIDDYYPELSYCSRCGAKMDGGEDSDLEKQL